MKGWTKMSAKENLEKLQKHSLRFLENKNEVMLALKLANDAETTDCLVSLVFRPDRYQLVTCAKEERSKDLTSSVSEELDYAEMIVPPGLNNHAIATLRCDINNLLFFR